MTDDAIAAQISAELDALMLLEDAAGESKLSIPEQNDLRLRQALDDAIASRAKIPAEQAKVTSKINELRARQATLTGDAVEELEIEVQYQHHRRDLVAWQLNRAADLAEERSAYLLSLTGEVERQAERKRCANGVEGLLHWFHYWAWTADPRPDSPLTCVPFGLFPFQVKAVEFIYDHVFTNPRDYQIIKSRDVGLSWINVGTSDWAWFFAEASQPYEEILGSYIEDYIDQRGNMITLFEKIRYIIDRVPGWMLPAGYNPKQHSTYARQVNPETGSVISGQAPTPNFARGARLTKATFDEFAFWGGGGYAQYTSASESTRCRATITTPNGKFNKAADLHFGVEGLKVDELELHWRDHPWKDDRWYQYQKNRQTPVEIAQELDLDFEGSVAGRLFPFWDERIHVITQDEFCRVFGLSSFKIPDHWAKGYAQDVGTSEDHPNVTTACAVASEDSPLPGNVFFFYELCYPVDGHPGVIAPILKEDFKRLRIETNCTYRLISHEGKSELLMYDQLGVSFECWDTEQGYTFGYSQMQAYLQPDKSKPHPFRPFLTDEKGQSVGAPLLYLVVANDVGGVSKNEVGKWMAKPVPKVEGRTDTLARLRAELPGIHIPQSEKGKPAKARRHYKKHDDAFDTARALAAQMFPPVEAKTWKQRVEDKLPENLQGEALISFLLQNQSEGFHALQRSLHTAMREVAEEEGDGEDAPRMPWERALPASGHQVIDQYIALEALHDMDITDNPDAPVRWREFLNEDPDEGDDDEDEN